MLGDEFQAALPLTNWMYPVNEGVVLPPSYEASRKPAKTVSAGLAPNQLDEAVRTALDALQGR